jgi:hypothetical protein
VIDLEHSFFLSISIPTELQKMAANGSHHMVTPTQLFQKDRQCFLLTAVNLVSTSRPESLFGGFPFLFSGLVAPVAKGFVSGCPT